MSRAYEYIRDTLMRVFWLVLVIFTLKIVSWLIADMLSVEQKTVDNVIDLVCYAHVMGSIATWLDERVKG
jgi:hypothetical protein